MDQLAPTEQLTTGQDLVAANEWTRLVLQHDGNLVLYRVQTQQALWASNTDGTATTSVEMQADGNLVARAGDGTVHWESGTSGHPGSRAVMQDDGNFVIYDASGSWTWDSDTVVNFDTPTIGYTDSHGYSYVETSERWQQLCSGLPCFDALQWPGYESTHIETHINGEAVVVQLWKGWCQKFLGLPFFPGGIGAEVGVYRRIPGKVRPSSLPFLPKPMEDFVLGQLATLTDDELWWPAPDLNASITMSFINSVTDEEMFPAGPETSYWLCKWMNEPSYLLYMVNQGFRVPPSPADYVLRYSINGQTRQWPENGFPGIPASKAAVQPVVRSSDHLDVFMGDDAGRVRSAAWEAGFTGWHGWWPIKDAAISHGSTVHAVSRSPDKLDIFVTDVNGAILTAAWQPAFPDGWRGWWGIQDGTAAPGAPVTAVSRSPDKLDVFVVGTDNRVWTAAWEPSFTSWHGWWPIKDATVPHGSTVHAVSRSPEKLDIFVTDVNGAILTAAWQPAFPDGWRGWWRIQDGTAAPGAPVTAVSRSPDKLDVFVVGTDNRVWTAAWEPSFTSWHGWWPIKDATVPHGSTVHAVSRSPEKLDIFVTDVNGAILTAAWQPAFPDGWRGWWRIQDGTAAPGAPVTAVSRSPDKLDVFVVGTDNRVWTAAWEPSFTSWHGWWPIES